MSRRLKQKLSMEARKLTSADSFVSVQLLSEVNAEQCTQEQFLEILSNFDDLCDNRSSEERSLYIE